MTRCDDCNANVTGERVYCVGCVEARETNATQAERERAALDLLRSARLYFADGHTMRDAIDRLLGDAAPKPGAPEVHVPRAEGAR